MFKSLVAYAAVALVLAGAAFFGIHRFWFYEEPRATGPLAEAMLAAVDPEVSRQIFNDIIADHVDVAAPLAEQMAVLERNGFDCAMSPVEKTGASMLECRRPIDGRRYCDLFRYFAYEIADGEIIESLAHGITVPARDRLLGHCPYTAPTREV